MRFFLLRGVVSALLQFGVGFIQRRNRALSELYVEFMISSHATSEVL